MPTAAKKKTTRTTKRATQTKTPPKKTKLSAAEKQCKLIAKVLEANKAEEIVTLDLANKCSFADFMIVASGRGQRHVGALADHVAKALKEAEKRVPSIEGKDSGDWVLIDTGDVVVHLFRPEVRQFYNIEKMWSLPAAPSA